MTFSRRKVLQGCGAAAAVSIVPRKALASGYPDRPVKLIAGNAAGGGIDVVARLMAQSMSARLGQPFVVEDRPGAGTNIATDYVVRAAPDGYTLLMAATPNAINASLYDNLSFDFLRDIAPVASVCQSPLIMVVLPSFPAKTVREFIDYAKANPGKLSYASAGVGTPLHIAGEMFNMSAGVKMTHVPYKGSGAGLIDLFGGQVQTMFADTTAIQQIKAGKLRALAVTTAARAHLLPDTPSMSEVLPGFEAATWLGIAAPRKTPQAFIDTLHDAANACLADRDVKTTLENLGYSAFQGSSDDFGRFIAKNTETWAKVVKANGMRAE